MRQPESRERQRSQRDLAVAIPLVALALYAVLFAARAPAILRTLYLNADIASGPVIAQSLASAPSHTEVLLGNYPWFEALLAMSLLRLLPGHRFLWEVMPLLLALVTFALVAWGTWRVANRNAALITLAVLLAVSPAAVPVFGTWTVHGLTWLHTALLGWLAIWLARPRSRRAALTAGALVGLACGPALASDLLLIPAGFLPLWATVLARRLHQDQGAPREDARTSAWAALIASIIGGLGALVVLLVAHGQNIRGAGRLSIQVVSPDKLGHNLRVLWESLAALGNGDIFNVAFGASTLAHAICAALSIVAVAVALWAAYSAVAGGCSPSMVAHGAFWGSVIVTLIAAFVFSSAPVAVFSGRYLVGVLLGVAALLPLAPRRPIGHVVLAGAVTFVILVGVMSLLRGEMTANPDHFPTGTEAEQVARYAAGESARRGYAGYWDAAPITWASKFATGLYPVKVCGSAICPYSLHHVASWYRPHHEGRTYLVLDAGVRQQSLTSIPPVLPKPLASARIGQLQVYVFNADISGYLGPPPAGSRG